MSAFQIQDPDYEARVRKTFAGQMALATLGVTLTRIEPGTLELQMPYDVRFSQQNGFLHGGIVSAGLDTACGLASYTLMPAQADILTVEFKINLLAPAKGQTFRFVGNVVKPGRTLVIAEGRAFASDDGREKLVATMSATMMTMLRRG
ncbi:PaaI family thioesterase [Afipia massiliensis]|uniref:Medium/long-chain acyl-CoA thioesterase YigI n=1 Tax=Afipia massiliensis TaxID=211460 RepID=A0A4U6BRJ5_9BRAD|nr:PaaI family thioesterase [Afipia massiliensis]TKT73142.1 PaaI family thioesterase [Afipia massiliensis]